jgi:putative sterol carrier protein
MTGVRAYMTGKIKVKGDLLLAQRLEEVFEKLGGRDVICYRI